MAGRGPESWLSVTEAPVDAAATNLNAEHDHCSRDDSKDGHRRKYQNNDVQEVHRFEQRTGTGQGDVEKMDAGGRNGLPSSSSSSKFPRFAWVTLVMENEKYASGALVLAQSLRNRATEAHLVCMVDDSISDEITEALSRVFDFVVEVPKIVAEKGVLQRQQVRFGHMYNPWLQNCLTKFSVFSMTQYSKVAFLDADMVCVGDFPDELFDLKAPAGILDLFRRDLAANHRMHGKEVGRRDLELALNSNCYAMRGCILLLYPDLETFYDICHIAKTQRIGRANAMAGPDEYFITEYFLARGIPWTHIHMRYGCISWVVEECLKDEAKPVFVHFVSEKPWDPVGGVNGSLTTTNNWLDFKLWDDIAFVVLKDMDPVPGDLLFSGMVERTKLPYVSGKEV